MEFPQIGCQLIHARVYTSDTIQVSTQSKNTKITCTTQLLMTWLCSKPTIFQGRWHIDKLSPEWILKLHQITGTMLFHTNAIDLTIIVALGKFSEAQTSGTIRTEKAIQKLLDFCVTYPDDTLWYKSSGMILKSHSDAFYFSEAQASTRAGIFFYIGDETNNISRPNSAIVVISTIICNIMLSVLGADCGASFYNAK